MLIRRTKNWRPLDTEHKAGGFLAMKNGQNLVAWKWRWHLQGGSFFNQARPLSDMRTEDEMARWRELQRCRLQLTGEGEMTSERRDADREECASQREIQDFGFSIITAGASFVGFLSLILLI